MNLRQDNLLSTSPAQLTIKQQHQDQQRETIFSSLNNTANMQFTSIIALISFTGVAMSAAVGTQDSRKPSEPDIPP